MELWFARYSKRAKDLLERYELVPPPKIIEVDLRGACSLPPLSARKRGEMTPSISVDDGDFIKAVLTRLTGRSTFPNVILRGKSIGGFDDIAALHEDGLRQLFENAGLQVRAELKDEEA